MIALHRTEDIFRSQHGDLVFRLLEALPQPVQIVALYESPTEGDEVQRILSAMHDPVRLVFRQTGIPEGMRYLYVCVHDEQDPDEVLSELREVLP